MAHAGPPPSHAAPHTSGTVLVSSFVCRSRERPLTTRPFPQEQPPEQLTPTRPTPRHDARCWSSSRGER